MGPSMPSHNKNHTHISSADDWSTRSWRNSGRAGRNADEEKPILIMYDRGDWEQTGPTISRARLLRFSKRAARELRPDSTIWTVYCQHYLQPPFFDRIFAWLKQLPLRPAPRNFVENKVHPELDPNNEWMPQLLWHDLILLNHCIDYVHLREPLDNKKARRQIWNKLDPDSTELDKNTLYVEDLHTAFHLLQLKSKWLEEAILFDPQHNSRTRNTKNDSTPSSLTDALMPLFKDWEKENASLLRRMVGRLAFWFVDHDMYLAYCRDLWEEAQSHGEDNTLLMQALELSWNFREQMRRPGRGVSS